MKKLRDYTIGEAMLICEAADDICWIHKKRPDDPSDSYMERCPFYTAGSDDEDICRIQQLREPAYWDVQAKPIAQYTVNEMITRCYGRNGNCEGCFLSPLCDVMDREKPLSWDI